MTGELATKEVEEYVDEDLDEVGHLRREDSSEEGPLRRADSIAEEEEGAEGDTAHFVKPPASDGNMRLLIYTV